MSDVSVQETSTNVKPEITPKELAEEFSRKADELFNKTYQIDPKYRTEKEDGSGKGIRIDAPYLYAKTPRRFSTDHEVLTVGDFGTEFYRQYGFPKEGAKIIRHRKKSEDQGSLGEPTGEYHFIQWFPHGRRKDEFTSYVSKDGVSGYLRNSNVKIAIKNTEAVIQRLMEAVSVSDARQVDTLQPK